MTRENERLKTRSSQNSRNSNKKVTSHCIICSDTCCVENGNSEYSSRLFSVFCKYFKVNSSQFSSPQHQNQQQNPYHPNPNLLCLCVKCMGLLKQLWEQNGLLEILQRNVSHIVALLAKNVLQQDTNVNDNEGEETEEEDKNIGSSNRDKLLVQNTIREQFLPRIILTDVCKVKKIEPELQIQTQTQNTNGPNEQETIINPIQYDNNNMKQIEFPQPNFNTILNEKRENYLIPDSEFEVVSFIEVVCEPSPQNTSHHHHQHQHQEQQQHEDELTQIITELDLEHQQFQQQQQQQFQHATTINQNMNHNDNNNSINNNNINNISHQQIINPVNPTPPVLYMNEQGELIMEQAVMIPIVDNIPPPNPRLTSYSETELMITMGENEYRIQQLNNGKFRCPIENCVTGMRERNTIQLVKAHIKRVHSQPTAKKKYKIHKPPSDGVKKPWVNVTRGPIPGSFYYSKNWRFETVASEGNNRAFKCATCQFVCGENEILPHINDVHQNSMVKGSELFCPLCNFVTPYGLERFINHLATHWDIIPDLVPVGDSKYLYKEKLFFGIVNNNYDDENEQNQDPQHHQQQLQPLRQYKCFKCNAITNTHDEMIVHLQNLHDDSVRCEICGDLFQSPNGLRAHKRSLGDHSNFVNFGGGKCAFIIAGVEWPIQKLGENSGGTRKRIQYKCLTCDVKIWTLQMIKLHIRRRHADPESFICSVCGKSYKALAALQEHTKVKHSEVDEPYICSRCGLQFSTMMRLRSHQDKHKEWKCEACHKKFQYKRGLRQHLKLNCSGVTENKCPNCNVYFFMKNKLQQHIDSGECTGNPNSNPNSNYHDHLDNYEDGASNMSMRPEKRQTVESNLVSQFESSSPKRQRHESETSVESPIESIHYKFNRINDAYDYNIDEDDGGGEEAGGGDCSRESWTSESETE